MKHFTQQVLETKINDLQAKKATCIRRLFLKYADGDCEDVSRMYKGIDKTNIIKFFKDFSIDYENNEKIKKIINEQEIS
jgi:hypothetical protein